jgi:hypothetical protein
VSSSSLCYWVDIISPEFAGGQGRYEWQLRLLESNLVLKERSLGRKAELRTGRKKSELF